MKINSYKIRSSRGWFTGLVWRRNKDLACKFTLEESHKIQLGLIKNHIETTASIINLKTLFVKGARVKIIGGQFLGCVGVIKQSSPDVSEATIQIDGSDAMTRKAFEDLLWLDFK